MFIKFENRHGKFVFTTGGDYSIAVLDVKSGNIIHWLSIKVLGEEGEKIIFRNNNEEVKVRKETIVSEIPPALML